TPILSFLSLSAPKVTVGKPIAAPVAASAPVVFTKLRRVGSPEDGVWMSFMGERGKDGGRCVRAVFSGKKVSRTMGRVSKGLLCGINLVYASATRLRGGVPGFR